MILKKIVEECRKRQRKKLACNDCEYMGKTCNHAKNILKVNRPSNYKLNKEEKDERFNKEK